LNDHVARELTTYRRSSAHL